MPAISRFYGIVVRMYFLPSEHNPPHIHVIYGENAASIEIETGASGWNFINKNYQRFGIHKSSKVFLHLNDSPKLERRLYVS